MDLALNNQRRLICHKTKKQKPIYLRVYHGVIARELDYSLEVNEFEIQSCYYVQFQINTFGKDVTPLSRYLMEILTFCVETTYFGMGSDIYRQEEGLAMGSSLSPELANIYMEFFKEMALGSTSLKPSMWLRYVDDTFILWPHQEDVQILLDHVNSIRPSI